jgi:hypothetical protein
LKTYDLYILMGYYVMFDTYIHYIMFKSLCDKLYILEQPDILPCVKWLLWPVLWLIGHLWQGGDTQGDTVHLGAWSNTRHSFLLSKKASLFLGSPG